MNLLIGRGERLITEGRWDGASRGKPEPYSLAQQQAALHPPLTWLAQQARTVDRKIAPRGEIAAKITLHPEFVAKTYFPSGLLRTCGLRLLGSRETTIEPRAMVRGKPVKPGVTATLIVAGDLNSFLTADTILMSMESELGPRHKEFRKLESIEPFGPADRLRINAAHFEGWAEVSLHASLDDEDIRIAFSELVRSTGGEIDPKRYRTVGGLTFVSIFLPPDRASSTLRAIEEFTHLRIVRDMPLISTDPTDVFARSLSFPAPSLPTSGPMDPNIRTAIFDGGFRDGLLPWVRAIDAPGVPSVVTDIAHGAHVTSAFLFGGLAGDEDELPVPYTSVDHVRVLPSTATDLRVMDVIDRIVNHLKDARDRDQPYQFANLSLGPRIPILDDDPHEWTVRLDDLLSLGDLFMTVAAGNDGDQGPELGRIQPPADAVNAFTVGSCDKHGQKAQRASFSCTGPGRSPGLVKPDALVFGGERGNPLQVYSPLTNSVVHQVGTSFSAPIALRLAAGVQASVDEALQPIMLHALLVSRARFSSRKHDQRHVGWGLLPQEVSEILFSAPDEVVVMYQGHIAPGQPLRAPIPLPTGVSTDAKVEIAATFAYRAPIDPAHPVNYTRAGLEIRFQPDGVNSVGFFSKGDFDTEQQLRSDALKWETCRHRMKKMDLEVLTSPSFVIRYQDREEGQPVRYRAAPKTSADGTPLVASERSDALPFALIIRIKVPGQGDLSQLVRSQFPVLAEVPLRVGVQTQVRVGR